MTYIIKCISGIHSKDDFKISEGQELEVSKEIYDYYNNNYGSSGKFNFISKGATKKAPVKEVKEDVVEKKVVKKVSKDEK